MFTGLIETVGRLAARENTGSAYRLTIEASFSSEPYALGESIAVNGACLTVVDWTDSAFMADVSPETLRRTNLGAVSVGGPVNLERAMRVGDRLGGHLVLGHVDGVGRLRGKRQEGNATVLGVEVPPELMPLVVEKGSITLDGISLTVNRVTRDGIEVAIVPHTSDAVALLERPDGWQLNLEVDILGKYVLRLMETGRVDPGKASMGEPSPALTGELLAKHGFVGIDPAE